MKRSASQADKKKYIYTKYLSNEKIAKKMHDISRDRRFF